MRGSGLSCFKAVEQGLDQLALDRFRHESSLEPRPSSPVPTSATCPRMAALRSTPSSRAINSSMHKHIGHFMGHFFMRPLRIAARARRLGKVGLGQLPHLLLDLEQVPVAAAVDAVDLARSGRKWPSGERSKRQDWVWPGQRTASCSVSVHMGLGANLGTLASRTCQRRRTKRYKIGHDRHSLCLPWQYLPLALGRGRHAPRRRCRRRRSSLHAGFRRMRRLARRRAAGPALHRLRRPSRPGYFRPARAPGDSSRISTPST